jgi:cytochrome c
MKRRQLITFIALPKAGWLQGLRVQQRHRVRLIVALSACILSSHSALSQQPASQGKEAASDQQAFNNACRTCHTIKEGDNRQGPNLHRIMGRKAGSLPDYNYSSAMKGADFAWDEQKLERFVASPDEVVPGNNMKPYSGLASADDRTKIIAYLRSASTGQP